MNSSRLAGAGEVAAAPAAWLRIWVVEFTADARTITLLVNFFVCKAMYSLSISRLAVGVVRIRVVGISNSHSLHYVPAKCDRAPGSPVGLVSEPHDRSAAGSDHITPSFNCALIGKIESPQFFMENPKSVEEIPNMPKKE